MNKYTLKRTLLNIKKVQYESTQCITNNQIIVVIF